MGTLTALFNECADNYGRPGSGCGPTGQLLQIQSQDFGASWGAVATDEGARLSFLTYDCHRYVRYLHVCAPWGGADYADRATAAQVANLTASLVSQGWAQLNPGPGTGVQLQHGGSAGRLLQPLAVNSLSHALYMF